MCLQRVLVGWTLDLASLGCPAVVDPAKSNVHMFGVKTTHPSQIMYIEDRQDERFQSY